MIRKHFGECLNDEVTQKEKFKYIIRRSIGKISGREKKRGFGRKY